MSAPPWAVGEPVEGEVLHFSRGYTAAALVAAVVGVFTEVFCLLLFTGAPSGPVGLAWVFPGAVLLLEAAFSSWFTWYHLARKPSLVLGRDRVQFRVGRHLRWEVRYGEVAEVALFAPGHPLFGNRPPRARCLGIKLLSPERFDASYPRLAKSRAWLRSRYGFDLGIPTANAQEPPVRCLEALLRCYHGFEAEQ